MNNEIMNNNDEFDTFDASVPLSETDMKLAVSMIMDGKVEQDKIASFLSCLKERGETVPEITGAALAMRAKVRSFAPRPDAVDCCGTGGDGAGTYNISTAAAFICAACGVPLAKHGNRAASSKSGAADVLEALNLNIGAPPDIQYHALSRTNFCFLMAPLYHDAMRYVAPVRKTLGFKTIFNLLGPLCNPAGTKNQLIGVFDKKWMIPMARTLQKLGTEKAWIVHGHDGLDEITLTGKTDLVILQNGHITEHTLVPNDFDLPSCAPDDLKGGDAQYNATALMDLLQGQKSAYRDIVIANCAGIMAMYEGRGPETLQEYAAKAAQTIDSGAAFQTFQSYKDIVSEK